jgi:hypothetical protein
LTGKLTKSLLKSAGSSVASAANIALETSKEIGAEALNAAINPVETGRKAAKVFQEIGEDVGKGIGYGLEKVSQGIRTVEKEYDEGELGKHLREGIKNAGASVVVGLGGEELASNIGFNQERVKKVSSRVAKNKLFSVSALGNLEELAKLGTRLASGIPFASFLTGSIEYALDRAKDAMIGSSFSYLGDQVSELQDGLENAKSEIESTSQKLTEQMEQMKSNLLDEIQRQEDKITQLQVETKKQLIEEQRKFLKEAIRQLTTAQENINRASHEQVKNVEAKFTEFKNELDQVKDEQKEIRGELQKQAEILRFHEQRLNSFAQEMEKTQDKVAKLEKQM